MYISTYIEIATAISDIDTQRATHASMTGRNTVMVHAHARFLLRYANFGDRFRVLVTRNGTERSGLFRTVPCFSNAHR